MKREKVKRNVPNLQTRSVFWMVVESIHDIRGISPYGDLGGTFGLGGWGKTSELALKVTFSGAQKSENKNNK